MSAFGSSSSTSPSNNILSGGGGGGGGASSISPNDCNVPSAGNDGISDLTFSPTSNVLVSTNWDSGVRCWNVQSQNGQTQALPQAQG